MTGRAPRLLTFEPAGSAGVEPTLVNVLGSSDSAYLPAYHGGSRPPAPETQEPI